MKYFYVKNDDLIITDFIQELDFSLAMEGYVKKDVPSDPEVDLDKVSYLDFDVNYNFIKAKYLARLNKEVAIERIKELKKELADEDYKVVKCYEAQLVAAEMPYDVVELVTKRNAIRNEINNLEVIVYG